MNENSFNKQQDYIHKDLQRISTGVGQQVDRMKTTVGTANQMQCICLWVIGCYRNIFMRGKTHLARTQTDYKPVIELKIREVSGLKKFYARLLLAIGPSLQILFT